MDFRIPFTVKQTRVLLFYKVILSLYLLFFFTFCFSLIFYFILQLINNVVLVSGVQLSDSVIHIHIYILFQILSHIGYYRVLSRVPCAIQ